MYMMELADRGLQDETRMMRDVTRKFVDEHVIPFTRQNWQQEWNMKPEGRLPEKILKVADEIGIRTLGVPEEFGGTPLDPKTEVQTFAVISEEISRGDCGLSDKMVQIWKVSVLLRNVAPRHLQELWFPRLVKDPTFLLAHCLTEPSGASDRWLPYNVPEASMRTRAVLKGDRWVINGRKQFISNGYDAKLYVVYANYQPESRHAARAPRASSSRATPRASPSQRCNETLGGRFMNNGEMVFEDMELPKDHLLVENIALSRAGVYFRPGKIIQGSKNLGVGVRAFEETAKYVQDYVQGGQQPHQAPGDRDPARRDGDQDLRGARPLAGSGRRGGREASRKPTCSATWSSTTPRKRCWKCASTRWSCTAATARCSTSASRSSTATPPCSCTWTARWTSPSSRS